MQIIKPTGLALVLYYLLAPVRWVYGKYWRWRDRRIMHQVIKELAEMPDDEFHALLEAHSSSPTAFALEELWSKDDQM